MSRARTLGIVLCASLALVSCGWVIGTPMSGGRVVDHVRATTDGLPQAGVEHAKQVLDIAYWHTSHGSQLTTGMQGMDAFYGGTGLYAFGGENGLRLVEPSGTDLGADPNWDQTTRDYLAAHPEVNVVVWSWCGQVSGTTEEDIALYLQRMTQLESEFPAVRFVYMTGHADGTGLEGNLHQRNQQIRQYCEDNGKYLYDFYDIECYDPDGTYFGDQHVTDGCDYDGGGNWALEWQAAHPGEWWDCDAAHTQPVNGNMKAIAAWQLWVRLAAGL